MLDVTKINWQSIHSLNLLLDPGKVDSFDFGLKLVVEVVGLQKTITEKIDMFLRLHPMEVDAAAAPPLVEDAEDDDEGGE